MSVAERYPQQVQIDAAGRPGEERILSARAREFLTELHRRIGPQRRTLLAVRAERQACFDNGELPDFLPETAAIRDADWTVAAIPAALRD